MLHVQQQPKQELYALPALDRLKCEQLCNLDGEVIAMLSMQASQELQQQLASLQAAVSDKETALASQAEAFTADKTALQQQLDDLSQQLKASDSERQDLNAQRDQLQAKCAKFQQVSLCPAAYACQMHRAQPQRDADVQHT